MKVDKIKTNIQTLPQGRPWAAVSSSNNFSMPFYDNHKLDKSNNGKFDRSEGMKNFWKGIIKPFKEVFDYAKQNPAQFSIICAASIGLTFLSTACPPIGVLLTGLGCYFIGKPLIKGIKEVHNAKNGDDKEKALAEFGEAATYTVLTFGASVLTKILPNSKVENVHKAVKTVHKGSKHTIRLFSNATDVASLAPKAKAAAIVTAKGMLGAEISYNTENSFQR